MQAPIALTAGPIRRLGFRFTPDVVRALMPQSVIGVYLLVRDGVPVYVGRSDHCLRWRLAHHEHLGRATHFFWEQLPNSVVAFHTEAMWFHRLRGSAVLLNRVHPCRPDGYAPACPFCRSPNADEIWSGVCPSAR